MTATDPTSDLAGDDLCPRCSHEVGDAWLVCAWCGTPLAVAAELPVGTRLGGGRYQVLRVLGRGGFGITYEVGDRRLERRVAMKELFPDSAVRHGSLVLTPPQARVDFRAARDRFLREARVLARFTHPGIVRVYEVFEDHGTAYLVMELLSGRTLVDLLHERGRPFQEAEVLDVAARAAAALRPVHAAGVLHRDVNPANVMLTNHGRVVVIDFGLARDYDPSRTEGMTRVVTPGYAPLEQYRGSGRFGPPTDVYGLAATCYRLASGRVPVSAVERDGGRELLAPNRINPAISKQVSDAILDGLELEPDHRPRDLDSFLARLGVTELPSSPRSILLDDRDRRGDRDVGERTAPPGASVAAVDEFDPGGATEHVAPPGSAAASRWSFPVIEDDDVTVVEPRPGDPDATVHERSRSGSDETLHGEPFGGPHAHPAPTVGGPTPVGPAASPGVRSPGRAKVTVPATAVVLAAASVAPVAVTAVMVLLAMPWLATVGDGAVHRMREAHGIGSGWAARRLGPAALSPVRFLRNVVVSLVRAIPMIGLGAVLLVCWYGARSLDAPRFLLDLGLRATGAVVVGGLLAMARDGSSRFRTGFGIDELVGRWVPEGRTTERVVVGWVVAMALVAGALWLSPEPFPLRW